MDEDTLSQQRRAHRERDLGLYFDDDAYNFHTETFDLHKSWLKSLAPAGDWLDAGCGSGLILEQVLQSPGLSSIVAIDISEPVLSRGKTLVTDPRVQFLHCSVYDAGKQLPRRFDGALLRFALHHFERAVDSLTSIAAALKPGGKIAILDTFGFDDPETAAYFDEINKLRQPTDYVFPSQKVLMSLLRDAGFHSAGVVRAVPFSLNLKSWLSGYEESERVLELYRAAPLKVRADFRLRSSERDQCESVEFDTFLVVAEKAG